MNINTETIKRRSAYFIFWAWHVIYVILVFGLIIPHVAWPLATEVLKDNVPSHYLIYALIMLLLPFVSIYFGATKLRHNFRHLMKYFYGFEMTLLFFLIMRMMTFRDANHAVDWLIINVVIALAVWFIFLWKQTAVTGVNNTANRQDTLIGRDNPLAITGSTILAMVGLYFGILFLIFMIPFAANFIISLGEAISHVDFKDLLTIFINPLFWLAGLFILFTMTLFVALPVVMIRLYIGQFLSRLPSLLTPARILMVLGVVGINLGVFAYLNQQPQQAVFTLLEENTGKPESETALLQQSPAIKKGLMNAYLARYRYVSTKGLSQGIKMLYLHTFNSSAGSSSEYGRYNRENSDTSEKTAEDSIAQIPQTLFNLLAMPFLYEGKDWSDSDKAQKYYESFFDVPIQKAERETILNAVKHNWEVSRDNEAGLLDAANHYVHLNQQSLTIEENQGVATISITQTLENLTYQQRETVLHFRLPNDAVLTGLWLSDDNSDLKKYPFVLAPKGAAQAVYKAEVNRRVDPALLEQTGPYQYRLRVYPIPRKQEKEIPSEPMYVQFSYQTLIHKKITDDHHVTGYWPLPEVLEKRNLFWDKQTEYSVNGEMMNHSEMADMFPKSLPKPSKASFLAPLAYQDGDKNIVLIPRQKSKEKLPEGGHFAVLIDGSYSMTPHRKALMKTLATLPANSTQFDIFFCRDQCARSADNYVFFGNSQTLDQLKAFSKIPHANDYDAILVLTDEGSYELTAKSKATAINLTPPLWLVHLEGALPYAYDDKVLDLLYQSKGGIASSLKEALMRNHFEGSEQTGACGEKTVILSTSENLIWQQTYDPQHECVFADKSNNSELATLVTAKQIQYLSRTMDTKQLDNLDAIHALAKQKGIVTHYSSMLVLVNDRQKEALKKAEEGKDRFDREVEKGSQSTTTPTDMFAVPSVPEPEEWALLIIVGVFLSIAVVRRRKDSVSFTLTPVGYCL